MNELKLEKVTHVLKAYKYYLMQITHCAFDEADKAIDQLKAMLDRAREEKKRLETEKNSLVFR